MTPNYNLDENKIKTLLDELNNDRDKYFADIKMSNKMEPLKESKIKALEVLIKNLLAYKKIIIKEKEDKEKDN
jgi:phosphopantetheinyl transferase (holo-ACP synthase)